MRATYRAHTRGRDTAECGARGPKVYERVLFTAARMVAVSQPWTAGWLAMRPTDTQARICSR
eukprot:7270161-Prymnesium_polylepis.1